MARPLLSCECVVCESHAGEAQAVTDWTARAREKSWQCDHQVDRSCEGMCDRCAAALAAEAYQAGFDAAAGGRNAIIGLKRDLFAARDALLTEGQARIVLEARVAALEQEDRLKTESDEACAQAAEARIAALMAALRRISYESQLSSWCAFCRGSAHVADAALDAEMGWAK
jgi:hypothetical protein